MTFKRILTMTLALALAVPVFAQDEVRTDSVPDTKEVKNRNVMLNASADNQPRQISIGLPSEMSATIYENGSPIAWNWWPMLPYYYWASSSIYGKISMTSLSENAITNGGLNYVVDSWTREGGDRLEGYANYTTNTNGLQRFSITAAAPIANGWSFAAGAYSNLDPGSNHLATYRFQNEMRQYMGSITKYLDNNKGKINLSYRYNKTKDGSDNSAPFIFVGDGSVEEYEGFKMGKDGFLPANGQVTYIDAKTGETKTAELGNDMGAMSSDLTFLFDYNFKPNLQLNFSSKYHYANLHYLSGAIAGVGYAESGSGFTYAYDTADHYDGEDYEGYYATRYLQRHIMHEKAWYNNAVLKGHTMDGRHNWRIGLNAWWVMADDINSTALYFHTVESDPVWLKVGGTQYSAANTGAEYYDSHETRFALYASDDWQVTDRFWLSVGGRLEHYNVGVRNAMTTDIDGSNYYEQNERVAGWSLADAYITKFSKSWVNPAAALSARYTILQGFGVMAEGIYTASNPWSPNFASADAADLSTNKTTFGKFGLFWNKPWIQLVSQVTYINKTNYQCRTQFTNPNDATDVASVTGLYDVQTIGWTTDVVLMPFKGFSFHGLLTLQDPKFKNYSVTPVFADGTSTTYDFSENSPTGVSKILIELDPSYTFSKFRIWASVRYQGKQYINRTNSLYFNGRWETFAGVSYNMNQHMSFAVNAVNLLGQKGASGSISGADLVTDTSAYENYVMAGSYIRPFAVEFSVNYRL